MNYNEFLDLKSQSASMSGFDPLWMPDFLFDFQKSLVEWSVRKGRAAIFADCGLGKTIQQLVWAENVVRQRDWSLDLARIWTTWLCERAALDGQLDVRMLYGAMDKSVYHFRTLSPEEFRAKLESRMI